MKNRFLLLNQNFILLFFLSLGTLLYLTSINFFANFPGDNLDSRFNHFVLEYFYGVLIGKNESFIHGNFLYNLPNTMNLSDNHWLLAPFYALIRLFGFNEILSYQIWVYLGFLANFLVCFYVFKKFKFNLLSCAIGAYLFSFNQINFAKISHIQLNFKIFIILGIWYFKRYIDTNNFKYASYIFLFVVLQLMCNCYTGNFFMLFLFFMILVYFGGYKIYEFDKIIPKRWDYKISIPILILSILILIFWSYPYYQTLRIYNLTNPRIIIVDFVFSDFFSFSNHPILDYLTKTFNLNSPKNHYENSFFIGFIPWIILIYFLLNKKLLKSLNQFEKILLKSTFFFIVFFLIEKHFYSFTILQICIKSFTNLRAYPRFFYVIFFVFIYFFTFVINNFKFQNNWRYLQILILILAVFEPFIPKNNYALVQKINLEYQNIKDKFSDKKLAKDSILYYTSKEKNDMGKLINIQINMMFLANELGVKTINGYSSYFPLYLTSSKNCDDLQNNIDYNEKIVTRITKKEFKYDSKKIITYCD